MKVQGLLLACTALLLILLAGCVPILSLNGWYDDKDIVMDDDLVGNWHEVDDSKGSQEGTLLTIRQDLTDGYTVSVPNDQHPNVRETYSLHLFRLNGQLFVDSVQSDLFLDNATLNVDATKIPTHQMGKISVDKTDFRIDLLDDEWVKAALHANPLLLAHADASFSLILTAPVKDLRKFLISQMGNEKAFSFSVRFVKSN